jgi:hypothetical protein
MNCRAIKSSEAAVRGLSKYRAPPALWITDDVLHAAFRRFAHFTCRRIDSRVHTGLQSQRSLAKRGISRFATSSKRPVPTNAAVLEVNQGDEELQWGTLLASEELHEPSQVAPEAQEACSFSVNQQALDSVGKFSINASSNTTNEYQMFRLNSWMSFLPISMSVNQRTNPLI